MAGGFFTANATWEAPNIVYFHLNEIAGIGRFIETERILKRGYQGLREEGEGECLIGRFLLVLMSFSGLLSDIVNVLNTTKLYNYS